MIPADPVAVADACWAGRLPVRDFPTECKRAAWRLVTDKVWRAARDIMKNEKVFRLRALRENYHEEFHELIKAEMMMLHSMGWRWERDENNRKHWILKGSDLASSPPAPRAGRQSIVTVCCDHVGWNASTRNNLTASPRAVFFRLFDAGDMDAAGFGRCH